MRKTFRWLLIGLGISVVTSVAGWTIWNVVAGVRLRAALKEVVARGLPARIEDIRPGSVPDEENAALLLNQAFLLMAGGKTEPGERTRAITELESISKKNPRDVAPSDATEIRAKLESHEVREILGLLHRAAERPKCDFGLDYARGAELPLPHIMKMRMAIGLLALEGWSSATRGDAGGAMRAIRGGWKIGGFNYSDDLIISWLVAASCDTVTLNWSAATLGRIDVTSVPCAEISRELKARRDAARPAFVRALEMERIAFGTWAFERMLSGHIGPSQVLGPIAGFVQGGSMDMLAGIGRPLLKGDYALFLTTMMKIRETVIKPYSAATVDELDRYVKALPRTALFTKIAVPAYVVCLKRVAEYEVMLDVARVGLMLEEHCATSGAYPKRLADVPGLQGMTRDPFSGGELMYRPDERGCRVWSVGLDGKDDGGKRKGPGAKNYDIVWEVERPNGAPPPSR